MSDLPIPPHDPTPDVDVTPIVPQPPPVPTRDEWAVIHAGRTYTPEEVSIYIRDLHEELRLLRETLSQRGMVGNAYLRTTDKLYPPYPY